MAKENSKIKNAATDGEQKSIEITLDDVQFIQTELAELENKIAEKDEQLTKEKEHISALENQLLRLSADFENYKKRERENARRLKDDGRGEIIEAVLPLTDTLANAVDMTGDTQTKTGLNMLLKQFFSVLEGLGVEEVKALGEQFDHNLHNAIANENVEDERDVGVVIEVLNKGYKYKDRIVRYADVKIGK